MRQDTGPRQDTASLPGTGLPPGDELLPCGRSLGGAWDDVDSGSGPPDGHPADCPYCREAADGLRALGRAARSLRAQTPGARPEAGTDAFTARVMEAVRAEVRLGRLLPLGPPEERLRVSEAAAAKVLRGAADAVPGVRAASCRLMAEEDGGVRVAMTLAAGLDTPFPEQADRVRRAVRDAADRALGLVVGGVDLEVSALLPSPDGAAEDAGGPAAGRPAEDGPAAGPADEEER
ncbi:Asp23/Gls24 family envelope stress response protein [Streptacidiphilus sp. ASG 303]|uniref:Asp23/Gls24 family envelope stress response protein n=1 Tax=Streptacidiphilus sp. ASG 303 TaxID=2896847 RepID=UPI001E48B94D|nr:Asp23/Gls24 family envelope stress response protein [Streptacidiphilus sp. ASG 303]MCD0486158.1 Asp23/Gls24 family envelope stress response protein [Streptacidiphilus sp. ASG 303]